MDAPVGPVWDRWTEPLLVSAERTREMTEQQSASPTAPMWDAYWGRVGSEDFLAAKALLELSPSIRLDATQWLEWSTDELWDDDGETVGQSEPYANLDWEGWVKDVDEQGRGWSGTEKRLFKVVAALVTSEPRAIPLRGVLDYMGSWETDVWRILTEWGTGGNNREYPGRATVVPSSQPHGDRDVRDHVVGLAPIGLTWQPEGDPPVRPGEETVRVRTQTEHLAAVEADLRGLGVAQGYIDKRFLPLHRCPELPVQVWVDAVAAAYTDALASR